MYNLGRFFILFFISIVCQAQFYQSKSRTSPLTASPTIDIRTQRIELNPGFLVAPGQVYEARINPLWQGMDSVYSPLPGHVFQRSNEALTSIPIRGKVFGPVDSVLVTATSWETGVSYQKKFFVSPQPKTFDGTWALPPGDYAWHFVPSGGGSAKSSEITRAGIGEVFLAWGHSFMQGPGIGQAAQDPRSRTIKTYFDIPEYNNNFFQNIPALPVTFEQITARDLGPFCRDSWIFGALADSLVRQLQMPVLIYSVAFGGSSVYQNRQNLVNEPFGYPWFGEGVLQLNGFPYRPITAVFQRYVPLTGLRAIWVHHGVNDHNNDFNGGDRWQFEANFLTVIQHIRQTEAPNHPIPFFLAREDSQYTEINQQIASLIQSVPQVYPGLDLRDEQWVGPWRDGNPGGENRGHFIGELGLQQYLRGWHETLHPLIWTQYPALLWQN